jgi:hypothetical protein
MKISHILAFSALLGVMSTVGGAVVSADDAAASSNTFRSASTETEILATLSAQPTFSDSTLRRPF